MRRLWVSSVVLIAMLGGSAGADEVGRMRADALTYLVRQDCGACHGMTLKGGIGKPLRPENLEGVDVEAIAEIILDGVPGTPMPPWRYELSRGDALWIARALKEGSIE